MASAAFGALPFAEQINFFRRKINLPTTSWIDLYLQEHDLAFVVAGANRNDILSDFRAAVDKAIADGTTLETFRRDFDAIVAKHGWDYNGGRNWRSRVIYETNLSTSYAAGRWEQLQQAPYWQYQHADWVEHPREQHVAWHGLVLAKDDPFWQTHFPPNGWGCQCSIKGLWSRDLEKLGKRGPDASPTITYEQHTIGTRSPGGPREVTVPAGIDPGFEYAPGAARLRSATPTPAQPPRTALPDHRPGGPLPPPQKFDAGQLLPAGLPPDTAVRTFLGPLGADISRPAVFTDLLGERLVVGDGMFAAAGGQLQVAAEQVHYLPLLAQAMRTPDEIWVRLEGLDTQDKAEVLRRYVARFDLGLSNPVFVAIELGRATWRAAVELSGRAPSGWRVGVNLYLREGEE